MVPSFRHCLTMTGNPLAAINKNPSGHFEGSGRFQVPRLDVDPPYGEVSMGPLGNRSPTGIEPEYAWSKVRIQAGAQVTARASLQLRRQLDRAEMAAPGKSTGLALSDR
jgi:hypothetical protein